MKHYPPDFATRALTWLADALYAVAAPIRARQRQREERLWLGYASTRCPVGAKVRCRCMRCAGRVWWVHGYDANAKDVRIVSHPHMLGQSWPPSHRDGEECSWADPAGLTVVAE